MKYEVIIPVYNGEDVIEACLRSITEQENAVIGKDYSVLVVDDGSTDRTVEIARRFAVEVINLGANRGRIVARLTGAQNARAKRILFIDSRVIVSAGLMAALPQFDSCPAVQGVQESEPGGPKSGPERILFLIRRKYYGPENYPIMGKDLVITAKNFKRSPKGTTLLLIDRELFLKLIPERTGKDVNDDTLLFHNLVFREDMALLRTPRLKIEYDSSRGFKSFMKWLYERGLRFADFYLRKGGYFRKYFLLLLCLACISIAAPILLPSHFALILLWILLGGYLFLCVYLSETLLDFVILLFGFPAILLPFGAGVLRYWIKSLF